MKRRVWIVVAASALCAAMSFLISSFVLPREYVATTRMYVLSHSVTEGVNSYDYAMSNYMASDLQVLITGQNVTDVVIAKLNLDMTHEELLSKIDVSVKSNTRVLQISVTDADAHMAADIANTVREIAVDQVKSFMDLDALNLVYEAKVPQEPTSPNVLKNTLFAAAVGLILSVCILAVRFFLDDTVKISQSAKVSSVSRV